MSVSTVLEFTGTVEDLEKELIPKIYKARIVSDDGIYTVEMDLHEEVKVYPKGTRVRFRITKQIPDYDPEDFVGKATLVSTRVRSVSGESEKEVKYKEYLLSIGGLIVILKIKGLEHDPQLKPLDKVYIHIKELKS